jgi:GT2 family glycosyltransferase
MNDVAIVILNFNGAHYLIKFLPSVLQFSQGCRIVIADNCSTDNSVEVLTKQFPQVELLQLKINHGYSQGYNEALRQIKSPYFILLNSDIEVTEGWWQSSIALLKSSEKIAAVQPKILSFHDKTLFEYAGAGGGFIDKLGYPFCRGRIFMSIESDQQQYNDVVKVFWASGACLFIKSECFDQVRGFDPDFFAHMEEIDLCWRLQKAGYDIVYNGKSHIFHVGGGTLERSHPRKTYLNFRNGLSLLYKNYTNTQLITLLPVRLSLDWIAALKFSLFDSPLHGLAVLRAHKFFLINIYRNKKKRNEVRKIASSPVTTIYPHSIVYQHFIKGIKKFEALDFKIKNVNNTTTS